MKRIATLLLVLVLGANVYAQDPWLLTADARTPYTGVTLANGYISLVTSNRCFDTGSTFLAGVYDVGSGYDAVNSGVEGPKATRLHMLVDGVEVTDDALTGWSQTLDMQHACAITRFDSDDARWQYTQYVLRNLPYSQLTVVEVTPSRDLTLEAVQCTEDGSQARDVQRNYQVTNDVGQFIPLNNYAARTRSSRYEVASTTTFLLDDQAMLRTVTASTYEGIPSMNLTFTLKAGQKHRFAVLASICNSRDFATPRNEAMRIVQAVGARGIDALVDTHLAAWSRIWESDIIIEGDDESQQDVHSALYHLYSFVGEDNRESPSPMGLSSNGYNRHVFWDSEIWMFPPLLMLNQQMAKSMVDYRVDRLPQAAKRARMFGFGGVMFPWECDDTGEEACPVWAITGSMEHHITADVGIAAWNYYCVTQDKTWLANDGWKLISRVAEFIVSRVEQNADGSYSISHVTGANEYAGNVDDNAYTNGSACRALQGAVSAARVLKKKPDAAWQKVADALAFHYFDDGVMKENATYSGQTIKQADVCLLAYPLGLLNGKEEVRRNLHYYESKTDPHGPAMGSCIYSTIYSSLGDSQNAFRLFKKSYEPHKCPPFGVLSESAGGSNPYFSTGAGGMLQAVLAGFGGLRITPKGIRQEAPCLPDSWTRLTLKGIGPDKKTYVVER